MMAACTEIFLGEMWQIKSHDLKDLRVLKIEEKFILNFEAFSVSFAGDESEW
jgi:hypothetical protein